MVMRRLDALQYPATNLKAYVPVMLTILVSFLQEKNSNDDAAC